MNIEKRVITVIETQLGMVAGDVDISSTRDTLCMDSLDDIECIMALEEEFELEISDYEAESLTSVKLMVDYIAKLN